jgi:alanine racemase
MTEPPPEIPRVFRPQRALPTDVVRPTRAVIDLDHLRHNVHVLRQLESCTPLWAVLKADAYGHGAKAVARTLERAGIDGICVALVEEGVELREAGVRCPVLVMGGYYGDAYGELVHHNLTVVLQDAGQLEALALAVRRHGHEPFGAHLKLDTGMGRLGARERDWLAFARALTKYSEVELGGLMTHFARADSDEESALSEPLAAFERGTALFRREGHDPLVRHAANSAAYLRGVRFDLARLGLALFGVSPFGRTPPKSLTVDAALALTRLRPVMSLVSRIVALRELEPSDTVGYGGTFCASRPTRVATVPMGYADGLSRAMSNSGEVLVRGMRAPIVGTVSMDMIAVDVTDVPGVVQNDEVFLLGGGETQPGGPASHAPTALEVAECSRTIAWEVLTNISRRVPRFYRGA